LVSFKLTGFRKTLIIRLSIIIVIIKRINNSRKINGCQIVIPTGLATTLGMIDNSDIKRGKIKNGAINKIAITFFSFPKFIE
jgi:ABC-type dipeptide/oligopeptide/nickel transport system permease component